MSEAMLANSRRLNPGVKHMLGDMRTLRLGREFSAVLIHDAVSYILSEEELRATFATASAHLGPGGVLITVPDWFRETFKGTFVEHHTITREDGEFTFTVSSPSLSTSPILTRRTPPLRLSSSISSGTRAR